MDVRTHRVSLINMFGTFRLREFPGWCPEFIVFLQLVDGIGTYKLEIEVVDLEEDRVVGRTDGAMLDFQSRPLKRSLGIPIRSPHPGTYDFILLGNGEEIERQVLLAEVAGEKR